MGIVDKRLAERRIDLPQASKPGANYLPFVRNGNLLFMTGQLSQWNGERRFIGKLGREFSVEQGQQAARLCGLNLIAHLRAALAGDLDRLRLAVSAVVGAGGHAEQHASRGGAMAEPVAPRSPSIDPFRCPNPCRAMRFVTRRGYRPSERTFRPPGI